MELITVYVVMNHCESFIRLTTDLNEDVYNMLVIDGCPEDRLQLVRDWMNDIITLQASLTMQQPPPPSSSLTNGAQ